MKPDNVLGKWQGFLSVFPDLEAVRARGDLAEFLRVEMRSIRISQGCDLPKVISELSTVCQKGTLSVPVVGSLSGL
jgi:hypothetical protein